MRQGHILAFDIVCVCVCVCMYIYIYICISFEKFPNNYTTNANVYHTIQIRLAGVMDGSFVVLFLGGGNL
jgi:hypothetical protein